MEQGTNYRCDFYFGQNKKGQQWAIAWVPALVQQDMSAKEFTDREGHFEQAELGED